MPDGTCALGGIEVSFRISLNTPNGTCAPEGIKASFRVSLNTLNGTCALGGDRGILQDLLKSAYFFLRVFTIHRRPCASVYFFAWTDAPSREA